MEVTLMPFGSLLAALEGIHDPRRRQGQRYSLSHLLLFWRGRPPTRRSSPSSPFSATA
jgi:hypothetical protein